MIRTNSVTLTTLPSAIAYRRKGGADGPVIVIVRPDSEQPGVAGISKTSGTAVVSANTPTDLFPIEAFDEAIALTSGMPYRRQGKPAAPEQEAAVEENAPEEPEVVVDSDEYQSVVDAYTNRDGRLSYELMNKDMIQLAHRSDVVARMVADGAGEDAILAYVIGAKFRNAANNPDLTDAQVAAMAALIDEVSPKGAFKELKAKVRQMLGDAKRA